MFRFNLIDPHFLPHVGCDVEFSLPHGECLVFVGENGVGKSTLAEKIHDHFESTSVFIPQPPLHHFYDRKLSVFKEILLSHHQQTLDADKFSQLWKQFGMNEKEDRPLQGLSGGENQALKLVVGLSTMKSLLILDEPTLNLDAVRKDYLKNFIVSSMKTGKSFIIIEHDLPWLPTGHSVIQLAQKDKMLVKESQWTT